MRPASTTLLCIDSEDRYKNYIEERSGSSSPFDFTINKSENIIAGFFTRVGVTEIAFPWTIPNINIKSNKIIFQHQPGGVGPITPTTITLAPGFYTPDFLAKALVEGVAAATGVEIVVEYGGRTSAPGLNLTGADLTFSYYATGGNAADFIGWSPMPYSSTTYPWPSFTKQLFDVLGFTTANTNVTGAETSGSATFCQWTRYVDIVCTQITANTAVKDAASQETVHTMLARLYVSAAPGQSSTTHTDLSGVAVGGDVLVFPGCAPTTIYKDYNHPKQIQWIPNQNLPGYLRFEVFDDSGAPLNEASGVSFNAGNINWSMTMQFSEN